MAEDLLDNPIAFLSETFLLLYGKSMRFLKRQNAGDIENDIKPQIQLLAENYVPAAKRFEKASAQIESMQADIEIMKKVIAEHSEKLQKIS